MPELSRRRRYLILAICCLSLFIVGLDVTIVNVAVPAIGRDFRAPVSGMPRSQAGVASGIASTGRQVGSSLGVAIMGSVLAANLHGPLASGFAAATRAGWWIVAALGVVVFALALATTGRAGKASAARAAALIAGAEEKIPVRAGTTG